MALSGTYIKYDYSPTGETVTETITYSVSMSVAHPDYEKRGTTEEVTTDVMAATSESLENRYLMVTGATLEKWGQDFKLAYAYRLYPNTDTENIEVTPGIDGFDSASDGFTHKFVESITWDSTLPVNLIEAAYEDLKTRPECANMSNA